MGSDSYLLGIIGYLGAIVRWFLFFRKKRTVDEVYKQDKWYYNWGTGILLVAFVILIFMCFDLIKNLFF